MSNDARIRALRGRPDSMAGLVGQAVADMDDSPAARWRRQKAHLESVNDYLTAMGKPRRGYKYGGASGEGSGGSGGGY